MTPPPPRHLKYPVPPCVYMESRARVYATAQTATATADGVLTLYKGAKTSESQRANQQRNRKRKRRLKRLSRRRRFSSHQRQHRHTKKRSLCCITIQLSESNTKTQNCRQNTQKRKNVREKKLAMRFGRVYYKLASNEGGSLRTGRSPHNRQ